MLSQKDFDKISPIKEEKEDERYVLISVDELKSLKKDKSTQKGLATRYKNKLAKSEKENAKLREQNEKLVLEIGELKPTRHKNWYINHALYKVHVMYQALKIGYEILSVAFIAYTVIWIARWCKE